MEWYDNKISSVDILLFKMLSHTPLDKTEQNKEDAHIPPYFMMSVNYIVIDILSTAKHSYW
jgi:hypothetical protein